MKIIWRGKATYAEDTLKKKIYIFWLGRISTVKVYSSLSNIKLKERYPMTDKDK